MNLVTHQTGPEGKLVQRLLIEETLPIEKELYLGILVDRAEGKPVFMASAAGGMDIEQVAAENPDAILKQHVDPGMGLEAFQARKIAFSAWIEGAANQPGGSVPHRVVSRLSRNGCIARKSIAFITTTDGRLFCARRQDQF
jgi:succinyl-CoA synthetase beta subunit